MKTQAIVTSLTLCLLLAGCGNGNDDSSDSTLAGNPYHRGHEGSTTGITNYAELINNYAQGKPKREPWAAHWWPYGENGIAAGGRNGPAGLYDAARGGTTHASEWEVAHHGPKVPGIQGWWGHCDGWSAAAALYPEPRQPVTVNGIEFGVADLKGLLTEAGGSADYEFFGNKMIDDDESSPRYKDTVANQYFAVLTNFMGRQGDVVNIDRFTGYEVWNQPVMGYKVEYPKPCGLSRSRSRAPRAFTASCFVRRSTGRTTAASPVPASSLPEFNWEDDPVDGTIEHRDLVGELWLDAPVVFDASGKVTSSGNLVFARDPKSGFVEGGAWHMDNAGYAERWPDYMWLPYAIPRPDMNDPEWPSNPWVDIEWIEDHLLVPGGRDDNSVHATPSNEPSHDPTHEPTHEPTTPPTHIPPTHEPTTLPTTLPTELPTVQPHPAPAPEPLPTGHPVPGPVPTH